MTDLQSVGKWLLLTAVGVAIVGLMLLAAGRLGLGSLPGDIRLQGRGWGCYLPIVTSLLLSLVLTLVLNLLLRLFR